MQFNFEFAIKRIGWLESPALWNLLILRLSHLHTMHC